MKRIISIILAATALGAAFVVATPAETAQAKRTVTTTETDDGNGHRIITYNGKQYSPVAAVKLGLISDSSVKAQPNRWTYKLTKVRVTRNKSKRAIKVSGQLKVTNILLDVMTPAKLVCVRVGGTFKDVKLHKNLTFKQTIKIRSKAKKVHIQAGYYQKFHGRKSFMTSSVNKAVKIHNAK